MMSLSSAPTAPREVQSYETLMAEKEHLDFWISDLLNKIQSYRESLPEWNELTILNSRITSMRDKIVVLFNVEDDDDIPSDRITSIQNDMKIVREYKMLVVRAIEERVLMTGEYNQLVNYKKELKNIKETLWNEFGIEVV